MSDVRDIEGSWFSHLYKGELIKLHPQGWREAGASPVTVGLVEGVSFKFRTAPPTSLHLPNHKSFVETGE